MTAYTYTWRVVWYAMSSLLLAQRVPAQRVPAQQADPYARYRHPGQCVEATKRLTAAYWRDKRRDTVQYKPLTDSAPTTVVSAARACAARFDLTTIPPRDLPDLISLYFYARNDSLANVTTNWLLHLPDSVLATQAGWREPGWLLLTVIQRALDVAPTRMDVAERYLLQLDMIHTPAVEPWRMQAHAMLARTALAIGNVALGHDEAAVAIRASQHMTRSEQIDRVYEIATVYDQLAEPTSLLTGGHAAVALFDSARTRLLPFRAPGVGGSGLQPDVGAASATVMRQVFAFEGNDANPPIPADADLQQLKAFIDQLEAPYKLVSNAAPSIVMTDWTPTSSDTNARPHKGAVTLVAFISANCGGGCYSKYAVLRRLHDAYASRGLQIVMLANTQGYFRNQPQPTPKHEAELARKYFLDFLQLPGVIGVEETKFTFRDDGIRLDEPGQTIRQYFNGRDAVIVGRDGVVREVVGLQVDRERMIHDVIDAALR